MARGIDSSAHQGALKSEGSTIAVLGTGIDVVYPREHIGLYQEISRKGLVISEYPIGTKSHPGLFPIRNRIIAGLCLGTVVVEAADKSGSLITADLAVEESRDVFAVPGPITSPKSQGSHALLKQGAKIVTEVNDIIEEYHHKISLKPLTQKISNSVDLILNEDEQKILNILSFEVMKIDEILERSKFPFGHLHSVLLSLLLKNKIEQLPGTGYIRLNE